MCVPFHYVRFVPIFLRFSEKERERERRKGREIDKEKRRKNIKRRGHRKTEETLKI